MLKKLIMLALALLLLLPTAGLCQRDEPSFSIDPVPFMDADDLIYESYLKLVYWTLENGNYSYSRTSRMRYIRLVEVFDSPYIFCSLEVKPPKVRKVYFQVVAKAKVQNPTKDEDIDMFVRIVEVIMEHVDGNVKYTYHVAVDKTMSGLPNEIKDYVSIKTLKRKQIEKHVKEGVELPPEAEIVDMKWGYWLAEFIKLYHLDFMEAIPSYREPKLRLREAALEELYGKESAGRIGHHPMPTDQSLLWAGTDHESQ